MSKDSKLNTFFIKVKRFNTLMSIVLVVLWMVSLAFSNYANSQNLTRNRLSQDIRMAEDHLRLVDANVSQLQTTQRIANESSRLDLVKIQTKDIYYLTTPDERVALNR